MKKTNKSNKYDGHLTLQETFLNTDNEKECASNKEKNNKTRKLSDTIFSRYNKNGGHQRVIK